MKKIFTLLLLFLFIVLLTACHETATEQVIDKDDEIIWELEPFLEPEDFLNPSLYDSTLFNQLDLEGDFVPFVPLRDYLEIANKKYALKKDSFFPGEILISNTLFPKEFSQGFFKISFTISSFTPNYRNYYNWDNDYFNIYLDLYLDNKFTKEFLLNKLTADELIQTEQTIKYFETKNNPTFYKINYNQKKFYIEFISPKNNPFKINKSINFKVRSVPTDKGKQALKDSEKLYPLPNGELLTFKEMYNLKEIYNDNIFDKELFNYLFDLNTKSLKLNNPFNFKSPGFKLWELRFYVNEIKTT